MTFAWSNFNKVTHASDSKTIKFEQGNLKFAKFKLQIINFLAKFAHQIKTEVVKTFAKTFIKAISLCQI